MSYIGKYKVRNIKKYNGDPTKVVYRSLWERQVMKYCDQNSNILWWNSESLMIPYYCKTDRKKHRYFVDFCIKYKGNKPIQVIEVKPASQTIRPIRKRGKRKHTLLRETKQYVKNLCKWTTAENYCNKRNMEFHIWTEHELKALGMKIV